MTAVLPLRAPAAAATLPPAATAARTLGAARSAPALPGRWSVRAPVAVAVLAVVVPAARLPLTTWRPTHREDLP